MTDQAEQELREGYVPFHEYIDAMWKSNVANEINRIRVFYASDIGRAVGLLEGLGHPDRYLQGRYDYLTGNKEAELAQAVEEARLDEILDKALDKLIDWILGHDETELHNIDFRKAKREVQMALPKLYTQADIDRAVDNGRRIQAEATIDKWQHTPDTGDFTTFLYGQVWRYESDTLTPPHNTKPEEQ